jgi:hypothetical protein
VKRLALAVLALAGGAVGGWFAFARFQGDSELTFDGDKLANLVVHGRTAHGEITVVNTGQQGGVLHRFDGRIVSGPPGRVLVTRKGSRPPERGWWVSNVLKPGDSTVAEVDVELDDSPRTPVVIEIDAHEIGRRLVVHRTLQVSLPIPA